MQNQTASNVQLGYGVTSTGVVKDCVVHVRNAVLYGIVNSSNGKLNLIEVNVRCVNRCTF